MDHPQSNIRYVYESLPQPSYFRLLQLEPGQYDDVVQCSITHHDIDEARPYEALSYVWGSPLQDLVISIDDRIHNVTRNLHFALRRLRLPEEIRCLWIDALCINQKDLEERNSQVLLMREIYENAKAVVIYLGEATDESERIPHLLAMIRYVSNFVRGEGFTNEVPSTLSLDGPVILPFQHAQLGLPGPNDCMWSVLGTLLNRPWFHRAWILQEAVAARQASLICGSWELSWKTLVTTYILAFHHGLPYVGATDLSADKRSKAAAAYNRLAAMALLKNELPAPPASRSLIDLLEGNRMSEATDERDRFYSLLALSTEARVGSLRPEYSLDLLSTYKKFATYFVTTGSGPQMLLNCHSKDKDPAFPSWLPNWSPLRVNETFDMQNSSTSIGADRYEPILCTRQGMRMSTDNDNVLIVPGILVDTISALGRPPSTQYSALSNKVHILEYIKDLYSFFEHSPQFSNLTADALEVLSLCIMARAQPGPASAPVYPMFEFVQTAGKLLLLMMKNAPSTKLPDDELFPGDVTRRCLQLLNYCEVGLRSYRIGSTEKGYLGSFPSEVRTGDVVAVMSEARYPFLLRPIPSKGNMPLRYRVIDYCYLHGCMRAEAFASENCEELGNIEGIHMV